MNIFHKNASHYAILYVFISISLSLRRQIGFDVALGFVLVKNANRRKYNMSTELFCVYISSKIIIIYAIITSSIYFADFVALTLFVLCEWQPLIFCFSFTRALYLFAFAVVSVTCLLV